MQAKIATMQINYNMCNMCRWCSKFYYQTPFIDEQTSDGVSEILEFTVAQHLRPDFIVYQLGSSIVQIAKN